MSVHFVEGQLSKREISNKKYIKNDAQIENFKVSKNVEEKDNFEYFH